MKSVDLADLGRLVTGRATDLFDDDLAQSRGALVEALEGRRVLVIGGAGSIGGATIRQIAGFRLAALHVVDQNENGLAELVRDLRSGLETLRVEELRTLPIDFGSPLMYRLLRAHQPYDAVLNFAALKHVRSEKDVFSLLQMLDTNVVKAARLLRWLGETGHRGRYFSVSTDKAANPVNLMGASKRVMEHVALSGDLAPRALHAVTSARFANVAFSDGSLLYGFLQRLQKGQPLAAPRSTRRFFVSLAEAGQICTVAALCANDRSIVIPRLDPSRDLKDLQQIAEAVLRAHELEPVLYDDEHEARAGVARDRTKGRYPLLLTPLDTSGEKPYEEFVGDGEATMEIGLPTLLAVRYAAPPAGAVAAYVDHLARYIAEPELSVDKPTLVRELASLVPQLKHIETGRTLDARM